MMPSFGAMLNASDLAAVISFTRNGLSNKVGDSVQPLIIKPMLAAMTQPEEDDDW
jgi:cytochrome c oxidase subunit 2